jgi:low temperature requirement protein LtrA
MSRIEIKPRWIVPMKPRSPDESHRGATPLELFFDLVFVVAVAQAASALHHGIADGHAIESLLSYAVVFFAIWLAWLNFTATFPIGCSCLFK